MASSAEAPGNTEVSIIICGPLSIIFTEIIHLGFLQARPKEASGYYHQEGKKPRKAFQMGHDELEDLCLRYIVGNSGYIHSQRKMMFAFDRTNLQDLLILTVLHPHKYYTLKWLF